MELYKLVLVVSNLVKVITSFGLMELKEETFEISEEMCKELGKDPMFDIESVIGPPWRIYYTWNMGLDNKCIDMTFKNASDRTINRIYNDMYEYLDHQPTWGAATLYLSMGKARHEILLFVDQGPAGRFSGVPNLLRNGDLSPMKKAVPLLKFQLKLLRGGKYLVMLDCHIGVASLSARSSEPPYRAEIGSAAAEVNLGEIGYDACVQDLNKAENFVIE